MFPVVEVEGTIHNAVRTTDVIFSGEAPSVENLKPADLGLREILAAVCEVHETYVRVFAIGR